MEFEGWDSNQDKTAWTRESMGYRALVSRFDGWNWGWAITNKHGQIIAGYLRSDLAAADAIKAADDVLDGGL